jgi:hypothetical protein
MVVDAADLALVAIAETAEDVSGAIDRQIRRGRAPLPRG